MTNFIVVGKYVGVDHDYIVIHDDADDNKGVNKITIKGKGALLDAVKNNAKKGAHMAIKGFILNNNELMAEKLILAEERE